jgi:hypothetical protein
MVAKTNTTLLKSRAPGKGGDVASLTRAEYMKVVYRLDKEFMEGPDKKSAKCYTGYKSSAGYLC